MNYLEKTYWDMQKDCILYGRKNEQHWANYAVIYPIFSALENNEKELELTVKNQNENDTGGHVAQKNQQVSALNKNFYRLSRKLTFYAKDKNDVVLLKSVDIAESDFTHESEEKLFIICSSLLQKAREYLAKTVGYGIDGTWLDTLERDLNQAKALPSGINLVSNSRKGATRSIKELNAEARILLDKLDDAFEGNVENDAFLKGWFDIRKIKGRRYAKKNGEKPTNPPKA